ncbi:MAG: hypothetical protein FWF59_12550 [Turicibacter sp.]|nr:hypothetical protein [Turicibacter sp.]
MDEQMESVAQLRENGQLEDYLKQVGNMNVLTDEEILGLIEAEDDEILATLYDYLLTTLEDIKELTEEEAKLVDLGRIHENIATIERHVEFEEEA